MKERHFASISKLIKLYLRRDRIIMPIWILLTLMVVYGQVSFVKAIPDWQEFIAELSGSPLTSSLLGPIIPLSLEGAILWRAMIQASMTVMFGASFTVIRHTRTEEISGRNELILGKPVGRYANLSAALILSCGGSFLAGLLTAVFLMGSGFAGSGSLLAGLTIAASGCVFAGVGGLCTQIFTHSGSARGAVFGIFGLTMVAMVLNNMGGGYTGWAWLAPHAWFRITIPFGENHAWPLLVFIVIAFFPIMLSYMFLDRRDMGAGFIAQKEGPANASLSLKSPIAFAWRQHRGSILIWAIGMAYLGVMMGVATPNISEAISSTLAQLNTWGAAVSELGNQEAFVAVLIYILGLMAGLSVFAITSVQYMKHEEKENLAEILLSRPVSRINWMGSHILVTFIGSVLILLVLGLATGLGWSITAGEFSHFLRVLGMSLSKIPPILIFIGIASLLYGWLPRISSILTWVILGIFILVEILWEVGIVGWSGLQKTPFAYAHYSIPINDLSVLPLIIMVFIAAVFVLLGLIGFKRRSIN